MKRKVGSRSSRAAALVATLWSTISFPAAALACPTCATRQGPGLGLLLALGAMILVPYLVAAVTIRAIRKLERDT